MKLHQLLSLMGLTVLLSTVSVNPSFSQSLKDKVNQQQSEKQQKEKNCQTIEENYQYERVSQYKTMARDPSKPFSRYYVDSSNNVHSVRFGHEWGWEHPDLPTKGGRTGLIRTNCNPFRGKVGEQRVMVDDCKFKVNNLGQTYSVSYKHIKEWSVEGDELKEYSQTITTENCHTNNPIVWESKVIVDGGIMKVR